MRSRLLGDTSVAVLIARTVLGGVFIYLGLAKAIAPIEFLKQVRQFEFVSEPPALNLVAAILPWFEVFCGVLLVAGVRPKAAALPALVLLAGFTGAVALRAVGVQAATGLPFCQVRFDCGCGAGEILICAKLAENAALGLLALVVLLARNHEAENPPRPAG